MATDNNPRPLERWLLHLWYEQGNDFGLLRPLSGLFQLVAALRRWGYRAGWLRSVRVSAPVVVVGNLSVGGTGKTPLVLYLAQALKARDCRPGIVLRGYGAEGTAVEAQVVDPVGDTSAVGDEAMLLAQRSGCPVAVGVKRAAACERLIAEGVDVIVCDDGLQHYALQRQFEIAVVDGARGLGNGRCLPGGPLREPVSRLQQVDLVVVNGDWGAAGAAPAQALPMRVGGQEAVNLRTGERRELGHFAGTEVHALAGIGNPARFFGMLRGAGLVPIEHPMADHASIRPADLAFDDNLAVLMTEKDAVKCRQYASERHWMVPVSARFDAPHHQTMMAAILTAISHDGAGDHGQATI